LLYLLINIQGICDETVMRNWRKREGFLKKK